MNIIEYDFIMNKNEILLFMNYKKEIELLGKRYLKKK